MTVDRRKEPKEQLAWGYYNFGCLIGIARTRRSAIGMACEHTGKAWDVTRTYMEVHKVAVKALKP